MRIEVITGHPEIWTPPPRRLWTPPSARIVVETQPILVSIGGVITIRERPYVRVIGHPDLAFGSQHPSGYTLYISIQEAIARERNGEKVEIHWTPTEEDERILAPLRAEVRRRRAADPLSKLDGWT